MIGVMPGRLPCCLGSARVRHERDLSTAPRHDTTPNQALMETHRDTRCNTSGRIRGLSNLPLVQRPLNQGWSVSSTSGIFSTVKETARFHVRIPSLSLHSRSRMTVTGPTSSCSTMTMT